MPLSRAHSWAEWANVWSMATHMKFASFIFTADYFIIILPPPLATFFFFFICRLFYVITARRQPHAIIIILFAIWHLFRHYHYV